MMTDNRWVSDESMPIEVWLETAWQAPINYMPQPIGTQGYGLPELPSLSLHVVTGDNVKNNIYIKSLADEHNYVLSYEQEARKSRVNIYFAKGAHRNLIVFPPNCNITGDFFFNSVGSRALIGSSISQISPLTVWLWSCDTWFFWGKGSTSNGTTINVMGDRGAVIVGEDCMFAHGISVRNSDQHAMLDLISGEHLNPAANTTVEPHTWVGQESLIMKGVTVGLGSVVGARSVVTRSIPRFSLATGVPAKVRRSGISWHRNLTPPLGYGQVLLRHSEEVKPHLGET